MKRILVSLCLLAAFSFANAQDSTNNASSSNGAEPQWLQNRIGLYGSFFSGYGLSFQHQFQNGLSIRSQLFAYGSNDDNNYNSDEIQLDYGIDLQYNLKRTQNSRLYALLGSYIDYYERGNSYYSSSVYKKDYNIERYINVGIGFGIEVMGWQNISIVVEGGYYGRFGNNTVTDYNYIGLETVSYKVNQNPKSFGFGVGGGVAYAF